MKRLSIMFGMVIILLTLAVISKNIYVSGLLVGLVFILAVVGAGTMNKGAENTINRTFNI